MVEKPAPPPQTTEACQREIVELHRFFLGWFTGKLDPTDRAFERLERALADDFEIVSPDGRRRPRHELVNVIRAAHGSRPANAFRIWIQDVRVRPLGPCLQTATYEEWQELDGRRQARVSSAVFRGAPGTPNGLAWVHLHEVWMPRP